MPVGMSMQPMIAPTIFPGPNYSNYTQINSDVKNESKYQSQSVQSTSSACQTDDSDADTSGCESTKLGKSISPSYTEPSKSLKRNKSDSLIHQESSPKKSKN